MTETTSFWPFIVKRPKREEQRNERSAEDLINFKSNSRNLQTHYSHERRAEEQKTLKSLIVVSNLRIRLNELLLLVSFFFRSLFSITVAYPLFQIETSLIAICFKLVGLQLFTITVASILSFVDPFVLNLQACSSTNMYLTFSVLLFYATSNGQRPELCCEYC